MYRIGKAIGFFLLVVAGNCVASCIGGSEQSFAAGPIAETTNLDSSQSAWETSVSKVYYLDKQKYVNAN
jgi:hypothetical protein